MVPCSRPVLTSYEGRLSIFVRIYVLNMFMLQLVCMCGWTKTESSSRYFELKFENKNIKQIQQEVYWVLGLLCVMPIFGLGSLSISTWYVTRKGLIYSNLSRVVDCLKRSDIHHSREARPSEKPQREARRPLAQGGLPAVRQT